MTCHDCNKPLPVAATVYRCDRCRQYLCRECVPIHVCAAIPDRDRITWKDVAVILLLSAMAAVVYWLLW